MANKKRKLTDYEEYLQEFLSDPENKRMYDEFGRQLEISLQLLRLRKHKKLSQAAVAKKLGTTQSNVARMEAGNQNFSLQMLEKIARTFNKKLDIQFR